MARARWLALLMVAGCAPSEVPPATVVVAASTPTAPTATATAWSAPEGPPANAPPAVEAPGQQGCLLTTKGRLPLRFRPGAPAFAWSDDVTATVDLTTAGPSAGAAARITMGGFTLQGLVEADALVLRPAKAVPFDGFVVPTPQAHLAWKGTALGSVTVAFAFQEEIEVLPEAHLDAVPLACDAVTLDGGARFDARLVAPRAAKEREGVVRGGRPVPLSRTPGGPPIARFNLAPGSDANVMVVTARSGSLLVRRERDDAVVFGWVPARAVVITAERELNEVFANGEFFPDVSEPPTPRAIVTCPRALPLVAVAGGERRTVGSVATGTRVPLLEPDADLVQVLLPKGLVLPEPGARIGVLPSHLGGCTPAATR